MPKVTFLPADKNAEIATGTTLLDAATEMGIEIRHDCGGFATCSTCRVWIEDGPANLSAIDLDEENMLEEAQLLAPYRLSCQAKVWGDVVVRIDSADAPDH